MHSPGPRGPARVRRVRPARPSPGAPGHRRAPAGIPRRTARRCRCPRRRGTAQRSAATTVSTTAGRPSRRRRTATIPRARTASGTPRPITSATICEWTYWLLPWLDDRQLTEISVTIWRPRANTVAIGATTVSTTSSPRPIPSGCRASSSPTDTPPVLTSRVPHGDAGGGCHVCDGRRLCAEEFDSPTSRRHERTAHRVRLGHSPVGSPQNSRGSVNAAGCSLNAVLEGTSAANSISLPRRSTLIDQCKATRTTDGQRTLAPSRVLKDV